MVRIDRKSEIAKPFNLTTVGLIVQDAEGNEVARFTQCTDGNKVIAAMKEACNDKPRTTAGMYAKELEKAEKLLGEKRIRECSAVTGAALRARLVRSVREKFTAVDKSLADLAAPRLAEAKSKAEAGDVGGAWVAYRAVRSDFQGVSAGDEATTSMAVLEKEPENKPLIGQAALDAAKLLAHEGKKADAQKALAQVASDFEGTQAATDARAFAKQIGEKDWKPDPTWKPSAPAKKASEDEKKE